MRAELVMDAEYHRRRAEMEMERALQAKQPDEALRHIELAQFHRERRELLARARHELALGLVPAITRTDKEC